MQPLRFPIDHPNLFWAIALIVSLYYGVRAVFIQRHHVANENIDERSRGHVPWTHSEQIMVHWIQDSILNIGAGLAGFAALQGACKMFAGINDFASIDGGTAAALVFLIAVAITGVTGILPMLLVHGKLLGGK